ncbi:MAG: betaine/proline/choline family ABC transporter ATP-binding protein [Castellaniella sp.]
MAGRVIEAEPGAGIVVPAADLPVAPPVELEVRDVIKVFGPRERRAVELLREGLGKSEVQQSTGTNVGLAGVSLHIPAGRITCIMGLSGSGKSTLVRHLNRLIDPSAGTILLNGRNILELSLSDLRQLRRHELSMVFQNFGLLPHLTVLDNVAFGLRVRGEPRTQARAAARQWLERVGLGEYARNYPDELSGGMRQRVGLARALATDAQVLLMDEAFSALDPLIRHDMQDQLLALQAGLHKTIVFITHDIDEALRLGQHIVILRDGVIEQAGTPDEIRHAPVNDYVRRFVTPRV